MQLEIEKEPAKVKQFIHDTFDFDICKNTYCIDNGKEFISTLKLNDIFHKIGEFKVAYRLGSSIKRYKKYTDRGFTISKNISYMEIANMADNGRGIKSHKIIDTLNSVHPIKVGTYRVTYKGVRYNVHKCDNDNCLIKFCNSDAKHVHVEDPKRRLAQKIYIV